MGYRNGERDELTLTVVEPWQRQSGEYYLLLRDRKGQLYEWQQAYPRRLFEHTGSTFRLYAGDQFVVKFTVRVLLQNQHYSIQHVFIKKIRQLAARSDLTVAELHEFKRLQMELAEGKSLYETY
ncbi:hypothetical protein [Loigolactobacillus zhaoyuanensis]|uniref:Uncharacterized protein n=1 Tax=Loigolactobacillus zhaoyuanensis TaxID=2486017 RepID=A0ABW8UHT5_9LACO|nr:hypothetical protein [Loigolactobacillus zhaoyuanensis]